MDFLQANNFKDKVSDNIIGCFEHEYEKEGVHYMDIYVHAASVTKVNVVLCQDLVPVPFLEFILRAENR